ncbi:MAG: chemotaxis protein CheA [Methylococcales bacterium]|jgi:two-component system, chemotaxis family, sensor kinase CheA|nr:chemotaxis protein CheA [Methylococcales bacterium]
MSIDMAQFHQVFFEESFEGLETMESGLLNLDKGDVDEEEINSIFRAAHSIKGGSGTFGFTNVAEFTHIMETLLDEMRDGRRTITDESLEALLHSVDCLRDMLSAVRDDTEVDEEKVASSRKELEVILSEETAASEPSGSPATSESVEVSSVEAEVAAKQLGWHIVFTPHANLLQTGNDVVRILRELDELGTLAAEADFDNLPNFDALDAENLYISWDLKLTGDITIEQLDDVFLWVDGDCDLAIMPIMDKTPVVAATTTESAPAEAEKTPEVEAAVEAPKPAAKKAAPKKSAAKKPAASASSIRVGIDKVDDLINMVGELVITQSMLGMLGEDFDMSRVDKLVDGLAQLERHTRELQESVMQIRMLPISFTFSRFPRLVHDLSSKMGKKIEFKMSGENTEVDKTVMEKIGDPLVHLVRNSCDHGIEMPEDRLATGKEEHGTVELEAYHKGGNIVIEIRDDGKGLDASKLLEKGIEKGLVTPGQKLSDSQIYDLIFMPGFSTAAAITDVSGRGVGMDVVRKNIQALGGVVEITSELGVGTTITIRLPLTLAILDGQTVAVGDEVYIIPLMSIIESIQVDPSMINLVAGKGETFKLRNEYLPIVRLYETFGVPSVSLNELTEGLLVVVEGDGRKCGLFVDDLLGQQQVVIKSLEANYRRMEGVSGATILGDGSVALIIDIPSLMRLANKH